MKQSSYSIWQLLTQTVVSAVIQLTLCPIIQIKLQNVKPNTLVRHFYSHSSKENSLTDVATVCYTDLEYAAPVRDPHQTINVQALEVQKFALRMSFNLWKEDYNNLLLWSGQPSLEPRWRILKLCHLAHTMDMFISLTRTPYKFSSLPHAITLWKTYYLKISGHPNILAAYFLFFLLLITRGT